MALLLRGQEHPWPISPLWGLPVMLTSMTWQIPRWVLDWFAPTVTPGFVLLPLPSHFQKLTLLGERTSLPNTREEGVGVWEEGTAQPEAQK